VGGGEGKGEEEGLPPVGKKEQPEGAKKTSADCCRPLLELPTPMSVCEHGTQTRGIKVSTGGEKPSVGAAVDDISCRPRELHHVLTLGDEPD